MGDQMKQQTIITHKVSDYTYNDRIEIRYFLA